MGSIWAKVFHWPGTDITNQRPGSTSQSQSRVWSGFPGAGGVVVVVGEQRGQEVSPLPLTTHFGIGTPHIFTVSNVGPTADQTGRFSPLGDTEGLLCVEKSPALGPTSFLQHFRDPPHGSWSQGT